ncbi:MAG: hypothetical protein K9H16_03845 [Bacteroidales bacterium]|nr:hypothetical protein [Bacteroidales bacterium]
MTDFDQALIQIVNDKQSGSIAILQQLIRGISSYLIRENNAEISLSTIHDRLPLIQGGLGHFGVVSHFMKYLKINIDEITKGQKSNDLLFDVVKQYDKRWKNANAEVAAITSNFFDLQNKTILLHSNSSVITSFFSTLSARNIRISIVQTESRPENEGQYQAMKLANLGFDVKFIVDTAAAFMMDKVDMMFTGADQIHKNYFVNKIGTYSLALLCREKKIPLYVLADSRKIMDTNTKPEDLYNIQRPGKDIWNVNHENIEAVNFYFEPIPVELVTNFFTETRVLLPSEL